MPSGLLSRRQFLLGCIPTIAIQPAIVKPATNSPLPGIPRPEFWFGDAVAFNWIDETNGKHYTEQGEIVGANWNQPENQWEYLVTWHSSTAYPSTEYPIADGNFISADVLSRVEAYAS